MKLVLVRHGLAVDRADFAKQKKDDTLRPLMLKGRRRSLQMAKMLKLWLGPVDLLVTSPYLRAKQTAIIFQQQLRAKKMLEVMELIPSAPPMAFSQWLRANAGLATSVVVVGHEPQLSVFASWILSSQLESFIELKKTGMIGIEIENLLEARAGHGQLKFVVTPKMFD